MARRHLAIFVNGMAEKILSGEKRVDVRLSQSRIPPYLALQKEDEILLKSSGGKIIGKASIDNCLFYDKLIPSQVKEIQNNYGSAAMGDEKFWESKRSAKFATIIFLKNPRKFLTPVLYKKNDRRAWVVLEEEV